MANRQDVQYIRFYTDGNAARQPEYVFRKPKTTLPKVRKKKACVIKLDPVAVCGIVMAVVLLVMMLSGLRTLRAEQLQLQQMCDYVYELELENRELSNTYESEIDLTQVEQRALALGMIPLEEARHITIQVSAPVEEVTVEEPTVWESICGFFERLFA